MGLKLGGALQLQQAVDFAFVEMVDIRLDNIAGFINQQTEGYTQEAEGGPEAVPCIAVDEDKLAIDTLFLKPFERSLLRAVVFSDIECLERLVFISGQHVFAVFHGLTAGAATQAPEIDKQHIAAVRGDKLIQGSAVGGLLPRQLR